MVRVGDPRGLVMFHRGFAHIAAISLATCAAAAERQPVNPRSSVTVPSEGVETPGTGVVVVPGVSYIVPGLGHPDPNLIDALAGWLSVNFGLPPLREQPRIVLAPPNRMAALRYRDVPSDRWPSGSNPDVIAVYDDDAGIIYLPNTWSGKTSADISVLVHEIVHHMQNQAHTKFACDEDREKMAFAAQERWLELSGEDLMTAFGIDPLTLLVRTNCPF